jgi:hypothetical protein
VAPGEIFDIWLTQSMKTARCAHSIAANKCSVKPESSIHGVAGGRSAIWRCWEWLTEFRLPFLTL